MTMRAPLVLAASAFAALACLGCGSSSLEVLFPGADGGVAAPLEAGVIPLDAGSPADYCSGTGSPVVVATTDAGTASACVGGLAQSAFRWALCTCDGLVSATAITTDSFDSAQGAYDGGAIHGGGGLGTNGYLSTNGTLDVGGALWVSDANGMTVATATTEGELHVAGRVASGPSLTVGADAYVLGDVAATGTLSITGTLHQPTGASVSVGGTETIGAQTTGSFTVLPPCDCDPALLIDVAAYVETYRANNDDAALGIDPNALANVTTDTTLAVPCGRDLLQPRRRHGGDHAPALGRPHGPLRRGGPVVERAVRDRRAGRERGRSLRRRGGRRGILVHARKPGEPGEGALVGRRDGHGQSPERDAPRRKCVRPARAARPRPERDHRVRSHLRQPGLRAGIADDPLRRVGPRRRDELRGVLGSLLELPRLRKPGLRRRGMWGLHRLERLLCSPGLQRRNVRRRHSVIP